MHLRRAILLFAIVLLLGALAASIAPPPETRREQPAEPPPEPSTAAGARTVNVEFSAAGDPLTADARAGDHVILTVSAPEAGEVEIRGLGLVAAVTAEVPARFDLLPEDVGRNRVLFTPAGSDRARTAGILVVDS